jgi:hypothetical protein
VSGLKGKKKALKKRLTSGGGTRAFRKWCGTRARAAAGDVRFAKKILRRGEQATLQLADILANMAGFADNIRDATATFTDDELGILRSHEPVTDAIVLKILDGALRLAMTFFLLHPNGKKPPGAYDVPYSFIFRFALCAFLHALHWRVRGGAEDRLAERMRNDVIDVTYAAYGLCFDGLLSEDKLVREIYDNANVMLALFTKPAPKPPHRRSNAVGADASAAATEPA